MSKDPWTDPDPQPGDFDALLGTIDPRHVEVQEGNRDATLRILVSVEGEDAERLERSTASGGRSPVSSWPSCSVRPIVRPHSGNCSLMSQPRRGSPEVYVLVISSHRESSPVARIPRRE